MGKGKGKPVPVKGGKPMPKGMPMPKMPMNRGNSRGR